jgi:Ala-tRNA(Pro) deacylase
VSAEKVREYLLTHGISYEIEEHELAYTTSRVAETEHVSAKEMAKPVILLADDRFVMVVVPGHRRVDLEKAKAAIGCDDVRMATEGEFAPAFGDCEPGAEPPLGAMYGMRTIVDERLTTPRVTFRGGDHTHTITMARDDYLLVSGASVADVAAGA